MNLCYYHSLNYQLCHITYVKCIYYVSDSQKLLDIINEI